MFHSSSLQACLSLVMALSYAKLADSAVMGAMCWAPTLSQREIVRNVFAPRVDAGVASPNCTKIFPPYVEKFAGVYKIPCGSNSSRKRRG